ncbi:MAG: hypothetical protein IPI67_38040 [Myxococcales bacterium]|nr:hypothetical protein [Myxococcales bacterium]
MSFHQCHEWTTAVYRARESWTPAFDGEQFSLGRAWYTHLEEDLPDDYFENAAASNQLVEETLPGMQQQVVEAVAKLTGGHAQRREAWCGPGVHVFPNGEFVSRRGGVLHFDTEGLTEEHVRERKPALSLLVMLQAPQRGGGIAIWDAHYSGADEASDEDVETASTIIEYGTGELCVFDSYRLHQIQPFGGRRDRIGITAHAAEVEPDKWEVWF